ncbi:sensor histidine kinase [Pseudoalteromonas luteoviolacea]|uniref:sensor histidine kinase n=1 Tax=Pseudoalteromonas luteoviolacea TaxID=43657 RepID=UPI001FFC989E|nr:ATP-binding protein [Pseudoalteromonas luteoviolacea]
MLCALLLLSISFLVMLGLLFDFSSLAVFTLLVLFIPFFIGFSIKFYRAFIGWNYNINSFIDTVSVGDFSHKLKSPFKHGVVASIYDELNRLSFSIQDKKDVYDQNIFLIYRLMEQLNEPVIVLNHNHCLIHANIPFSRFIGKPWKTLRMAGSDKFGLVMDEQGEWQFQDKKKKSRWQLRQSQFQESHDFYHLIILIDIEKEIRQTQRHSWQQIIRVLSHEIRNSLTPIASLSEAMLEDCQSGAEVSSQAYAQALETIHNRSKSLSEFVSKYAELGKSINLRKSVLNTQDLFDSVLKLFPSYRFQVLGEAIQLQVDKSAFEQVIINLIKNAVEAAFENTMIQIEVRNTRGVNYIFIRNVGHKIVNEDNLFVPYYSTKEDGQGIGLFFCRDIVEKHEGRLTLQNSQSIEGVEAIIELPAN